ncbi:MAG: AraC family transcriptional regulator [Clostridia bacterium]|nr:AraC family transcriptional regulator [Clostridia bacterium]MDY6184487.1 AraC family transcriptional regulator [Eubacteriales bacterium]
MDLIKPSTYRYHFDNIMTGQPIDTGNFSIIQIGDLMCENDTIVEEHVQIADLEISYISEGGGMFSVDGVSLPVGRDDVHLCFRGERHKIDAAASDTLRYYYFALNINEHSKYGDIFREIQQKYASANDRIQHMPFLLPNLTNMLSEMSQYTRFSAEMLESYIIEILVLIYRNNLTDHHMYRLSTADLKKSLVDNIVRYIDENCDKITYLSDISAHFNYDYHYISKLFQSHIRMSLHAYFQNAKLNQARKMLMENLSVTDIANALNYSSIHSFSRAYKNKFGYSPSEEKRHNPDA